jgi:hypothetical protein
MPEDLNNKLMEAKEQKKSDEEKEKRILIEGA